MNRNVLVVGAVVALLVGFAVATQAYKSGEQEKAAAPVAADPGRAAALERADAVRIGNPDAKVVVVEFFDPACETCAKVSTTVKSLATDSGGKVQIVQRYAPLHPGSDQVCAMLEAAKKQGKYSEALEIMFQTQPLWASHHQPNLDGLWGLLEEGGIDIVRLRTDMNDPAVAAAVAEDQKDALTLGVKATPEFFVNGKPLPTWGMPQLATLVNAEVVARY